LRTAGAPYSRRPEAKTSKGGKNAKTEADATTQPASGTTFDLSAPELKSPDGTTFEVPKVLDADTIAEAVISPNNIKQEEWMIIAKASNILFAFQMDRRSPSRGRSPVLEWKVPETSDFMQCDFLEGDSGAESHVVYTAETRDYVKNGFDSETASIGCAFCSASFERSHKEKTAQSSAQKHLYILGLWRYPRAILHLDKCTAPSPRFINSIKKAVASANAPEQLEEVFSEYGHLIPFTVTLGGQMFFEKDETVHSSASEKQVEDSVKAAVDAKYAGVTASGGFAYQTATGEKVTAQDLTQNISLRPFGGDETLRDPTKWTQTVKQPSLWAAIKHTRMKLTVELLDKDLREQVLDIWARTPPALFEPDDLPWKDGEGAVVEAESSGFVVAMRQCGDGPRGSVLLTSGSATNPAEGRPGTAAGAAYAHKYTANYNGQNGNTWYECNSVCLPVPGNSIGLLQRARGHFSSKFEVSGGAPGGRLGFIKSKLLLGNWGPAFGNASLLSSKQARVADTDGFLFVSVWAEDTVRGGALCRRDGQTVAGSHVHFWSGSDERILRQSFLVPIPARARFEVDPTAGFPAGNTILIVNAYWMPIVGKGWKLQIEDSPSPNMLMTAETDGVVHGWLHSNNNERGTLRVYMGADAAADTPSSLPFAAASILQCTDNDRYGVWSSVALPVPKGVQYKAVLDQAYGSPKADLFWTAIVPA
jgi:hypothetical protein